MISDFFLPESWARKTPNPAAFTPSISFIVSLSPSNYIAKLGIWIIMMSLMGLNSISKTILEKKFLLAKYSNAEKFSGGPPPDSISPFNHPKSESTIFVD
jgi:hypothetical protein